MTICIDIDSPICPSCGQPKQDSTEKDMTGRPLCWYCYRRGENNVKKMFLLYILAEQEKAILVEEIIELANTHPMNGGKFTLTIAALRYHLRRLSHKSNRLITYYNFKGSVKTYKKVRITPLGRTRLQSWLKAWDNGFFTRANLTAKDRIKVMKPENKNKHLSIAKKIKDGEYGRFDFFASNSLKQEKFHLKHQKV